MIYNVVGLTETPIERKKIKVFLIPFCHFHSYTDVCSLCLVAMLEYDVRVKPDRVAEQVKTEDFIALLHGHLRLLMSRCHTRLLLRFD